MLPDILLSHVTARLNSMAKVPSSIELQSLLYAPIKSTLDIMAGLALLPITTKLAKAIAMIQIVNDDFEKVDEPHTELYRLKEEPLQKFKAVIKEIINEIVRLYAYIFIILS